MATWTGCLVYAAVLTAILWCCPGTSRMPGVQATVSGTSAVPGLLFLRDPSYDDLKVTSDPNGLDLIATTATACSRWCSLHGWCTSFFYTDSSGSCTLHATVFIDPSDASDSVGTRYYRHVVDWCSPQLPLLYNRQAQMCMYFETDPGKRASDYRTADSECANKGMKIASVTPVKMEAILNITKSSNMTAMLYIGLWREPGKPNFELQWMGGEPLDVQAAQLLPWGQDQPDGGDKNEHCVVIKTDTYNNHLEDVACGVDHEFVCELLRP